MRYLNYSGAAKIFLWVAQQLQSAGHNVIVYAFSNNISTKLPSGLNIIHEDLGGKSFFAKVAHIREQIRKSQADISISFLLDANVYNVLACLGLQTKSVICERNDPFKPHYTKLKIFKPILGLADGAVFQLPRVREFYSNIRENIAVIPNPITEHPTANILPFAQRLKRIVTIGRVEIEQKRNDIQIEAFAKFHKNHPDYELWIYGSSTNGDVDLLKKQIEDLHLNKSIILAGVTNNVEEVLSQVQIFLITSDYEGIPNSLIEAMVVGLPCVATDCSPGGAALLIENGKNGILVNKRDVEAIAAKLEWLVSHTDEADKMGEEAKRISEKFSVENIREHWINYIETLR